MVELGKSKTPLDENIIPEKVRKFFPTLSEWASLTFEQISGDGSVGNATAKTIHTVPKDKILYITDAYIAIERDTNPGAAHLEFGDHVKILRIVCNKNNNNSLSLNLTAPLVVRENETVVIQPQGGFSLGTIQAGFHGFEIEKKISFRL